MNAAYCVSTKHKLIGGSYLKKNMKMGSLILRELEDQFVPMLQNCRKISELKRIHPFLIKHSLSQSNFLTTKMIDLCNCHRETEYANLLFNQITEPNIFLCNAILRTYTQNHLYFQSIALFKQILRYPQSRIPILVVPDKFTYPIMIKSSSGLLCLDLGKQIHGHVCKCGFSSNSVVENSLMDMYTKCEDLIDALKVFEKMTDRDAVSWNTIISGYAKLGQMKKAKLMFESMSDKRTIVSWTTMISGYTRIGCFSEALHVFHQMQLAGLKPDEISIVSVLPACANLGSLEVGKWIHNYAERNGLLAKICICNALMEMYAKCGSIEQALQLFDQMYNRDVISWSTIIGGLANHGKAREAIELFETMKRAQSKPNGITFLGLLSACAHAGFLEEGLQYFDSMKADYFIDPSVEHYGCMVDLLGRSGCLDRAVEFIEDMPIQPDSSIWGSLLGACRTHGNLEIAVVAMKKLVELEPDDAGNYVLLSNIYARLGKWDDVSRMRKLMRNKKMKKTPGCSSIEVNNLVKEFSAGDESSPFSNDMYLMLKLLALQQSYINSKCGTLEQDLLA